MLSSSPETARASGQACGACGVGAAASARRMSLHDPNFIARSSDPVYCSSNFVMIPHRPHPARFAALPLHGPRPQSHQLHPASHLCSHFISFIYFRLSHLALATFDWTYTYVLAMHLRSVLRVIPNHISTRYTPMYFYPTTLYTLLQYLSFYGTTPRAEYLCTHSKNHPRSSGSTPGVMPCPRFAIHPFGGLAPARNVAHMRRTPLSIASLPPYSLEGSRFPCSALFGAAVRASSGTTHQSRPRTS